MGKLSRENKGRAPNGRGAFFGRKKGGGQSRPPVRDSIEEFAHSLGREIQIQFGPVLEEFGD